MSTGLVHVSCCRWLSWPLEIARGGGSAEGSRGSRAVTAGRSVGIVGNDSCSTRTRGEVSSVSTSK